MFKKQKSAVKHPQTSEPVKSPAVLEAEKVIARGERIKRLASEAEMWRKFASDCKPGRLLYEEFRHLYCGMGLAIPERLQTTMDEDSAPLWVAFAAQMAAERERRLKDVLGV